VAVWKLRRKLSFHGIEIHMKRGVGYYLDDANKAKIEKLLDAS
jgi:biotin operon repressor